MKEAIIEQVNLTRDGLVLHEQKMDANIAGLHEKLTEMFSTVCTELGKYVCSKLIHNVRAQLNL